MAKNYKELTKLEKSQLHWEYQAYVDTKPKERRLRIAYRFVMFFAFILVVATATMLLTCTAIDCQNTSLRKIIYLFAGLIALLAVVSIFISQIQLSYQQKWLSTEKGIYMTEKFKELAMASNQDVEPDNEEK